MSQSEKAKIFNALHHAKAGFIMPNPWDIGTARIMATRGYKALATSSAAVANTLGRPDYKISRDEALEHCRLIAAATDLSVTADLENGFADKPDRVADMVLMASETGIVGCSIEDSSGDPHAPLYPFEMAVERVRLSVVAARRLGFPFTLTARTEEMALGGKNLDEAIRRLQAFEKVGASVVYATGLLERDQVARVLSEVKTPLNVMAMPGLKAADLIALGVKRVSLGPWFYRAAMKGLLDAMTEVEERGTFEFARAGPSGAALADLVKKS